MLPALKLLLAVFPFKIKGFHAGNGGEYINYTVAELLDKLRVEFTKSRPRHSNDNALVESKNGSVIRKLYGYTHIPQQYAADFADLNRHQVHRYVNFHRPCYFPTTVTDKKGKERKQYRYEDMMTPYEKFRSLARPSQYLKPGITLKQLDAFANEITDNEAAEQMNLARDQLFKQLHERLNRSASRWGLSLIVQAPFWIGKYFARAPRSVMLKSNASKLNHVLRRPIGLHGDLSDQMGFGVILIKDIVWFRIVLRFANFLPPG